ncbi:MAG: prepilin peptidase [Opitutales bacterium]|nr:prepilin peptidase [Opitutales bacterium]
MLENLIEINVAFPYFWAAVFFVFGAVVGSFLNVCILRIPRGESIVTPGSHCACGKAIPLWHNIPILSWIILRGRAACCGRHFSIRYPAIELLTAISFCTSWILFPWDLAVAAMIYISFAIVLSMQDYDSMSLPDSVLAWFIVSAVICGCFLTQDIRSMATGLATGTTVLLMIRFFASCLLKREAMGEGDIYLMAGIGAFWGWGATLFALFVGSLIGLLFSFVAFVWRCLKRSKKVYSEDDGAVPESGVVPFGPPLLIAGTIYVVVAYFWGYQIFSETGLLFFTRLGN